VDDVRWFGPNAYTALVVETLRRRGLAIAREGDGPARVALSMSGSTALEAWRYARRRGCPLVLYVWDLPPHSTGTGSYDPVFAVGRELFRVPRLRGGFPRRRGYYSRLRYIAAAAHEVWVPSHLSADLVQQRFGLTARRVPYCYDSERFRPTQRVTREPPVLLTVGRLQGYKNHAATVRAAAALGRDTRVRLIGRGPEASALQRMANTLGVSCRIETDADDAVVVHAYQCATVAVCPSRFEGLGVTPLEAIASGTPTVASDIPPHREFVSKAARLFAPDDDEALVHAIRLAFDDGAPDPATISELTIPAAADRFFGRLQSLLA